MFWYWLLKDVERCAHVKWVYTHHSASYISSPSSLDATTFYLICTDQMPALRCNSQGNLKHNYREVKYRTTRLKLAYMVFSWQKELARRCSFFFFFLILIPMCAHTAASMNYQCGLYSVWIFRERTSAAVVKDSKRGEDFLNMVRNAWVNFMFSFFPNALH